MSAKDLDEPQQRGVRLLLLLAVLSSLLVAARLYVGALSPQSKNALSFNLSPYNPPQYGPLDVSQNATAAVKTTSNTTAKPVAPVMDKKFTKIIKMASTKQGVDPHLITAVIKVESNFQVGARSDKGARGLMQLMPQTVRAMGVKNPFDPQQNIRAGVKYLAYLLKMFDYRLRLALAAYNAGPTAVLRHGGVPPYAETQNFVRKVLRYYADLQSTNG